MFKFEKNKKQSKLLEPAPKKRSFFRSPALYKGFLLLTTCLMTAWLIKPQLPSTVPEYHVSDVSGQDIKAPQDFLAEDTASTIKKRLEREEESPSVYDFDANAPEEAKNRLLSTFSQLRKISEDSTDKLSTAEKRKKFQI